MMDKAIDLNEKIAFVKKQSCFLKLSASETDKLATLLIEQHFMAGETIVTEGDLVDSVYLIIQGQADVRHITIKEGAIQINSIATLTAGAAIGLNETGFYSLSGRRTATVVAITDMVVLCLSVAKFHGFALAYPHVNEVMHQAAKTFLANSADLNN
jgi:CRP-like cAMP-binding protein